MADAAQLISPLREALIPVPAQPQNGVCSICHSSANPGFTTCIPCATAIRVAPPEILPITLSVHGELIHNHLRNYKDSPSQSVRDRSSLRLAGLLSTFMAYHGACVGDWDYVACVPSVRRVAPERIVRSVRVFADRYRRVLTARPPSRPNSGGRVIDPAQFTVTGDVTGKRILLIDDSFVSGAKLFSSVAALRNRGAVVVGPVVIGRHIQRNWPASAELLSWIEGRPWDERRCAHCGGERRTQTLF